jgi:hypothetical protein
MSEMMRKDDLSKKHMQRFGTEKSMTKDFGILVAK